MKIESLALRTLLEKHSSVDVDVKERIGKWLPDVVLLKSFYEIIEVCP